MNIGGLDVCEALEGATEVGLDKYAADRGTRPSGMKISRVEGHRPKGAADWVGIFQQASVGDGVHWKSVPGELEGRGNDFPEGHGPISFQAVSQASGAAGTML